MIYIVYKDPKDKEKYKDYFNKINKSLYNGSEEVLKKFYSRVAIIDYSFINNTDLAKQIDSDSDYISTIDNNLFYKIYDPKYKLANNEVEDMVNLYTHAIACTNEDLNLLTRVGTDYTDFDLFYSVMNTNTANEITDNQVKSIPLYNELTTLGLIAFSNSVNVLENNDLIKGYLYDRKFAKKQYENIMGEDSVTKLNCYFLAFVCTIACSSHLPEKEFLEFLEDLKVFFFIRMSINNKILFNDKNEILTSFEKQYNKLKNDYLNKKTL